MRVMINTDVLLDHIANRAPYADTEAVANRKILRQPLVLNEL